MALILHNKSDPHTNRRCQGKYDFNRFFSGWFMNAEIKDIKRGNIREMLAWVRGEAWSLDTCVYGSTRWLLALHAKLYSNPPCPPR